MEVVKVLHMNGGLGDTSYANNSLVQRKVISMTKPITEEAIAAVYGRMVPKVMCMADLGCSSGPNTLLVAMDLVKSVDKLCQKLGHPCPEFQISLNDLPGNDFNSIFRWILPRFRDELKQEMRPSCFVSGVPGTFYGRLFASNSLHFVHSSYSLMWLSKVPEGVEMNKENIYIASTSPSNVVDAYYHQFQADFGTFLKCRSEEILSGGKMVLTILGRKGGEASSKDGCYIWELLALALRRMVTEGHIPQNELHSFHIPQYIPSPTEVEVEVAKEGSFIVERLEASDIPWAACGDGADGAYNVAQCMRSVAEALLTQHFGESVIDKVFETYKQVLSDSMAKEDPKFINVTVSMTRIALDHS